MNDVIEILFIGDIVGRPGRRVVKDFLEQNSFDFVIANVENASHGFGLTKKNHEDLKSYGINAMTSGNHIWDKNEIFNYISEADKLIRPINYPEGTAGVGSLIVEKNGIKYGVINVLGTTFMGFAPYWDIIEKEVKKIKEITPIVFIDIHAEATAEKICFFRSTVFFSQSACRLV